MAGTFVLASHSLPHLLLSPCLFPPHLLRLYFNFDMSLCAAKLQPLWTGLLRVLFKAFVIPYSAPQAYENHDTQATCRENDAPDQKPVPHQSEGLRPSTQLPRTAYPLEESHEGIRNETSAFSMPLDAVRGSVLDLGPFFSEHRYRFINTDAFLERRTLEIYEMADLPHLYTAVSYVWFGLTASDDQLSEDGSFRVHCGFHNDSTPREDGGPISLKVLKYACMWASNSSSSFLWIDRLCIMQSSKRDKEWQINRMYDIYEGSEQCVVLPGGLQRLASVGDETSWANRAWTYQEAIVTWDYAVVLTKDWHRPKKEQHWLVEGECHWQYLNGLFVEGEHLLATQATDNKDDEIQQCLILGRDIKPLHTLARIMEYLAYNELLEEGEECIPDHTIRQLILQGVAMRTSSRPVDMVFSILGLMGAHGAFSIDVGSFGSNERFRATLALVEAVIQHREEHFEGGDTMSSLFDVPLWSSLELEGKWDAPRLPTLSELGDLLDGDKIELKSTSGGVIKRAPLKEWLFDVDKTEDEPDRRAEEVAKSIPEDMLRQVYEGTQERTIVQHVEEGTIELCRRLENKPASADDDEYPSASVFGWSLRLKEHPYIRFYFFGMESGRSVHS